MRALAANYHPLPVVLAEGEGSWVVDVHGRRYLDFLAAYSALNFGHRHPRLVAALEAQLGRLTLTSRAFGNDVLDRFAEAIVDTFGHERVLPMNTGAEAVETAIKAARRWGYVHRGVPDGAAEIVVCAGNFHGRTTTIVSFSDDHTARDGFGPFTPGFVSVPHGDADALAAAVHGRTVAVLVEPVQGEAGVIIPPPGWLADVRRICDDAGVLLICDEIQSGLGRTGSLLAADHDDVRADLVLLGKALGGGLLPVSAVVGDGVVLDVLDGGRHGSTFGGNPLAAAVGLAVLELLRDPAILAETRRLGTRLDERLRALPSDRVIGLRTIGLWAGLDLAPGLGTGRDLCEAALAAGVLVKDTHGATIRIAPPLTIADDDLDLGCDRLATAIDSLPRA